MDGGSSSSSYVPWCKWLVVGLLQWRPQFDYSGVFAGFFGKQSGHVSQLPSNTSVFPFQLSFHLPSTQSSTKGDAYVNEVTDCMHYNSISYIL